MNVLKKPEKKLHFQRLPLGHIIYVMLAGLFLFRFLVAMMRAKSPFGLKPVELGSSYFGNVLNDNLFLPINSKYLYLFYAVYILATFLIGKLFILRFASFLANPEKSSPLFSIWLPFLPGYLLTIAINRLFTAVLSIEQTSGVLAVFYIVITSYSLIYIYKNSSFSMRRIKPNLAKKLLSLFLFYLFILNQMQMNLNGGLNVYVLADSAVFNYQVLQSIQNGSLTMLPLFNQHYDEILYLYPVSLFGQQSNFYVNLFPIFLVMYSLVKISCFAWIYDSLNIFFDRKLTSFLVTLLLFVGNLSANPLTAPLLFDSGSNLLSNCHGGRVIVVAFLISSMSCLYARSNNLPKPQLHNNLDRTLATLFGVGLASLTISIFIALGFILFSVFLKYFGNYRKVSSKNALLILVWTCGTTVFNQIWAYVLFLIVLAAYFAKISLFGTKILWPSTKGSFVTFFILGYVIGISFLGNITSSLVYDLLGKSEKIFLSRGIQSSFSGLGLNPNAGVYPFEHQLSITTFIIYYGFPIAIIAVLVTLNLLGVLKLTERDLLLLISTSLFFGFAFFLWDATNLNSETVFIWTKSRLVEPMFYLLIIVGVKLLISEMNEKFKVTRERIVNSSLFIWVALSTFGVLPGGVIGQIISNHFSL